VLGDKTPYVVVGQVMWGSEMPADAEQTLYLRLSRTALELVNTMQATEDKELLCSILFIHRYATVTKHFKVQTLCFYP